MKKRSINTTFRSDTWIENLDPLEKLLFIYIFTNDRCSWSWCSEITIKKIGYETGIDKDMVLKILGRFEEVWKIKYINWYILIKNFLKYHFDWISNKDKWSKNNQLKAIQEEINRLSSNMIQECCLFIEGFNDIYTYLTSPLQAPWEGVLPFTSSFTSSTTITSNTPPPKKPPKKKTTFSPPTIQEVEQYFTTNQYTIAAARKAWAYYDSAKWIDSNWKKVLNWKQKMISVRFKEENKQKQWMKTLTPEEIAERTQWRIY